MQPGRDLSENRRQACGASSASSLWVLFRGSHLAPVKGR